MGTSQRIEQKYSCVACLEGVITRSCLRKAPEPEEVYSRGMGFDPCEYQDFKVEGGVLLSNRQALMMTSWGGKVVPGGICKDCLKDVKIARLIKKGCLAIDDGKQRD